MALYELLILGVPTAAQVLSLTSRFEEAAEAFKLIIGSDLVIRTATDAYLRNRKAATAAAYFGGDPNADGALIEELDRDGVPVIPVVDEGVKIEDVVPDRLKPINGLFIQPGDGQLLAAPSSAVLECAGLLHEQRRVFLSYRRTETREAAVQLHDLLVERGFDVFLDTHDIRPGRVFQEMLWHRMTDSDVVIMLDSKDFFTSKWTTEEIGRALTKEIHILRLIWPGNGDPDRHLNLAEAVRLTDADLEADKTLTSEAVADVVRRSELLRSRSIAARHLSMVGKLRNEITRINGEFIGVGPHRSVHLRLPSRRRLRVFPVVGVPTAQLLNDAAVKGLANSEAERTILVYDHVGISSDWLVHLKWLDDEIAGIKAFRIFDLAQELIRCDR